MQVQRWGHSEVVGTLKPYLLLLDLLPAATKLRQGNVFTGICDSVHRGGGSASVHAGIHPPWSRPPPGAETHPLGADPPRSRPPRNRPPQEQTPPSRHPPREADSGIRSTSGRYTSYWNAFLFELFALTGGRNAKTAAPPCSYLSHQVKFSLLCKLFC